MGSFPNPVVFYISSSDDEGDGVVCDIISTAKEGDNAVWNDPCSDGAVIVGEVSAGASSAFGKQSFKGDETVKPASITIIDDDLDDDDDDEDDDDDGCYIWDGAPDNVSSHASASKKRPGNFGDEDSYVPQKVQAVGELGTTGGHDQLDEHATQLWLQEISDAVHGLISMLPPPLKELVTTAKKDCNVLDKYVPDHIKAQYHVLRDGDDFYDAMLNHTNVGKNNNKFYVIQALESEDLSTYMVYNRWGRVGVKGRVELHGPYTTRHSAILEFELKFLAKTKNRWVNRKSFILHPKCHAWLEMDYSETENKSNVPAKLKDPDMEAPISTKLDLRIAKLISIICNVSMMKKQMLTTGYNAGKMPLGKLSKSTIMKGYGVLKRIADVIDQSDRQTLEQLSGEFYTVIPHDFGFENMSQFIIDTPDKLKAKLEMVEALGEIELANKILKGNTEQDDVLYCHYKRLNCELLPVDADSKEYSMVKRYMRNTQAATHSITADIVQVFRVSRQGESERFEKFNSTKNRMLLWHGSRLTNWMGILSQGLRIAPPEAPASGYAFGKGVYFADMFSKSANYCFMSPASKTGVLLLCEVALGEMAELLTGNHNAHILPPGKQSTKGVGRTAPDPSKSEALEDGVLVPLGKPIRQQGPQGNLLYNEYIVYNVEQIRMRYLVQVDYNMRSNSQQLNGVGRVNPYQVPQQPSQRQLNGVGLVNPYQVPQQPSRQQSNGVGLVNPYQVPQKPSAQQLNGVGPVNSYQVSQQSSAQQLNGVGLVHPYQVPRQPLQQQLNKVGLVNPYQVPQQPSQQH